MGEEADADWQDGLVEWGREDTMRAMKPRPANCRCGWYGEDRQLIRHKGLAAKYCPACGRART